jgi:hypothetical protein
MDSGKSMPWQWAAALMAVLQILPGCVIKLPRYQILMLKRKMMMTTTICRNRTTRLNHHSQIQHIQDPG